MEHKSQHFVPESYLAAWCDPNTPSGQEPYVWCHKKDGTEVKRKSPGNIFCETDYYTFRDTTGNRNLFLEKHLGQIETHFTRIRRKIDEDCDLPTGEDLDLLCVYVAMMFNRVKAQRENMLGSFRQLYELAMQIEKASNRPATLSPEIESLAEYGHHFVMAQNLPLIMDFLDRMSKALLFSEGGVFFITSDVPCCLYDPQAYRLAPSYRGPGFDKESVQLTFPISPTVLFAATWSDMKGAQALAADGVQQLNRRHRFLCHEYFITHDGHVNPYWFASGKQPSDSWENRQKRETDNAPEEQRT